MTSSNWQYPFRWQWFLLAWHFLNGEYINQAPTGDRLGGVFDVACEHLHDCACVEEDKRDAPFTF